MFMLHDGMARSSLLQQQGPSLSPLFVQRVSEAGHRYWMSCRVLSVRTRCCNGSILPRRWIAAAISEWGLYHDG
jgi:hypothetical protein